MFWIKIFFGLMKSALLMMGHLVEVNTIQIIYILAKLSSLKLLKTWHLAHSTLMQLIPRPVRSSM